ncbi:MAG: DMT family transporter [Gemmatimonadota bacterium]|nr:MAG: DMT family transporter [Gemmatimonadota bacterium]
MNAKQWSVFITLACLWGSSFLWIKIAVQESSPLTVVTLRLLTGLLATFVFFVRGKPETPSSLKMCSHLLIQGLIAMAIPWILIFWAEQHIDSTVATVLNATVPLFTILVAHVFLDDDRMTVRRVQGLLLGFFGVIVLVHDELISSFSIAREALCLMLLGHGALLLSSAFYGASNVYARAKFRGIPPILLTFYTMLLANIVMWPITLSIEIPFTLPARTITWTAILWLGALSSGLGWIIFYHLIHSLGPTRASTITYLIPVIGVSLGIIFLGEGLDWSLIAGTILILSGIWFTNRRQNC